MLYNYMKRHFILLSSILIAAALIYFSVGRERMSEWDRFCEIATEAGRGIAESAFRAEAISNAIRDSGDWSEELQSAFSAYSFVPQEFKYEMLRSAATDAGFPDWQYPIFDSAL